MILVDVFVTALRKCGVDFFCGVPDSLLKSFCAYLTDTCGDRHVITANEGGAVALASGHYLATGKPALVYMQNSGQGNAVNPLASLADPDVYSIPMVLLVGWRGEPGVHDEPQHVKQGKITLSLFETLGIPTEVLPDDEEAALALVAQMAERARAESRPVALVVRKGLFAEYKLQNRKSDISPLRREEAIETILKAIGKDAVVVSTTGMISREVYETRERLGQGHEKDFLTVGSMGHSVMIALGIARQFMHVNDGRDVYVVCIDGDGAALMQTGNMAIAAAAKCPNLLHIVLNNAAHDSVGGQPTVAGEIDFAKVAEGLGYYVAGSYCGPAVVEKDCKMDDELAPFGVDPPSGLAGLLRERIDQMIYSWACDPEEEWQTTFLEIKVAKGARKDLGRPKEPPQENKGIFMQALRQGGGK